MGMESRVTIQVSNIVVMTSVTPALPPSCFFPMGNYNSVKHAGGWANLEIFTRHYGAHSFKNDR